MRDKLLSEADVARYLGVRRDTVRKLYGDYQGTFPYPRRDGVDEPGWVPEELDDWLSRNGRSAPRRLPREPRRRTAAPRLSALPPTLPVFATAVTVATVLVLYAQRLRDRASNV